MASTILPGLLSSEISPHPFRLFLGHTKGVEATIVRNVQSMWPWVASRRKVREETREYYELDLASCDPEVILRWSQVYYVRRHIHADLVEKATAYINAKKDNPESFPEPSENVTQCLAEIYKTTQERREYEKDVLTHALHTADKPFRRELDFKLVFSGAHFLVSRRYVEDDVVAAQLPSMAVNDYERKAKHFLPTTSVEQMLEKVLTLYTPMDRLKPAMDKKDSKFLEKCLTPDYTRLSYVQQYRPFEIPMLYKYTFQSRLANTDAIGPYQAAVYANVLRCMASHPGHLVAMSNAWTSHAGLQPKARPMPIEVAKAVGLVSGLLPASSFATQYLMTSTRHVSSWAQEPFSVPLLRAVPLVGNPMALDLVASLNVRRAWKALNIPETATLLEADQVHAIRAMIDALVSVGESVMCEGALEGAKVVMGSLTDVEVAERLRVTEAVKSAAAGDVSSSLSSGSPAATNEIEGGDTFEEGYNDEGDLPNEYR